MRSGKIGVSKSELDKVKQDSIRKFKHLYDDVCFDEGSFFHPLVRSKIDSLPTGCEPIDELIGGGIPTGCVTEVFGNSGSGKTHLCYNILAQFCLNNHCNQQKAIYIDTENSFLTTRLCEIIQAMAKAQLKKHPDDAPNVNCQDFLQNVYFIPIVKRKKLLKLIEKMESLMAKQTDVKLLIIDSAAAPFWYDQSDVNSKTHLLVDFITRLTNITQIHQTTVVVTNRLSGKGMPFSSLGKYWSHFPSLKLYLAHKDSKRTAEIVKSHNMKTGQADFAISEEGLSANR